MKFLKNIKFFLFGSILIINQVNAVLTPQEEQEIIQEASVPQELQDALDPWFSDDSVIRSTFIEEKIKLFPNEMANLISRKGLDRKTAEELNNHVTLYWQKINSVCEDYSLNLKIGTSFVLTLPTLPNYVVRINRIKWPLNIQNISRVFYAKEINRYVEEKGFSKIIPLKAFLYHIPGRPTALNDSNYLVIQENVFSKLNNPQITSLPPKEINMRILRELKDHSTIENEDLRTQIVHVTGACGLWDFDNGENMILVPQVGGLKAVFVDTEIPGFGGGSETHFFHKGQGEVDSNTRCGFRALHKLITS